jgi:hypothetical protein
MIAFLLDLGFVAVIRHKVNHDSSGDLTLNWGNAVRYINLTSHVLDRSFCIYIGVDDIGCDHRSWASHDRCLGGETEEVCSPPQ